MHPILSQYLDDLSTMFEINTKNESELFEYFCNYVITSRSFLGRFDPRDITTQDDDASIDGISFIIDGELILSLDDAKEAFETHKNSLPVEIIITQVKSGEQFKKENISNFKLGIDDFLSIEQNLPNGKYNSDSIKILNTIVSNVKK